MNEYDFRITVSLVLWLIEDGSWLDFFINSLQSCIMSWIIWNIAKNLWPQILDRYFFVKKDPRKDSYFHTDFVVGNGIYNCGINHEMGIWEQSKHLETWNLIKADQNVWFSYKFQFYNRQLPFSINSNLCIFHCAPIL